MGVDELQHLGVFDEYRGRERLQQTQDFIAPRQIPAAQFTDHERVSEDLCRLQHCNEADVSTPEMIDPY
jgi:hypothetical protein